MLFDGTFGAEDIVEILDRMAANCPRPSSQSRHLWRLRRATDIAAHNRSGETMLEKVVAMLAANGHMPGWFNQCPAASGIGNSTRHRHSNVDLAHWRAVDGRLSLVELKWDTDSPSGVVRQILRYGAAYLYLPDTPGRATGRQAAGDVGCACCTRGRRAGRVPCRR